MSNIWLDFDPLARNKAKAAAPVTSLEQAEVHPTKPTSSGQSHSSSLDRNPHQSKHNADEASLSSSVDGASDINEAIAQPRSNEVADAPGTKRTEDMSEEQKHRSLKSEARPEAKPEAKPEPKSKANLEATPGATPESTPEANLEAKLEVKSEAKPEPQQEPQQEPQGSEQTFESYQSGTTEQTEFSPKSSTESSTVFSKLTFPEESDNQEMHPGELRKNSIAALKELGDPISTTIKDGAPEDEDSVASFDFQTFMDSLRAKSATPIAKYIKSFLQEFVRGVWTPAQQEKILADFHRFIYVKLQDYEPFASMSRRERRNSMEGVEKLVMTRLYTRTFSPKMPPILRTDGHNEDLLRDQVFEEKLRLWGWLEGRHLDINEEYLKSSFVQLATTELGRLHQFKSPRDKVICILNCSKVIYALIRQAQLEQNADSFLPLLIYVVLKAHPVHLVSTINYIQRFRAKEFQRGETAYYLSTLASAVTFLETLDKASLTITDEEFNQRMTDSVRSESNRRLHDQAEEELINDEEENPRAHHDGESSAAVLTASAGILVDRMRKFTTKIFEDLANPEEEQQQQQQQQQHQHQQQRQSQQRQYQNSIDAGGTSSQGRRAGRGYVSQERAAREASREEYRQEQALREQFNETSATLQNMFPSLDKEIIEDVLHQNGTNVGSAVDICLALVG